MSEVSGAEDCLFCKIAGGEIESDVVHESATTFAFRDLDPQAPTHVLVIPRSHYANAADLAAGEPGTAADLFDAARAIADQEGLGEGYRLVFNTGRAAHQTVFHAHMHVLGGRAMTWPPG
jgi:histidine triad (HIT) family protein